jgi:hypothetical protein
MDFAFPVTPPLSKRFSLPEVLYHVTKAAPLGPRSERQATSLVINLLPTFFTPPPMTVPRTQFLPLQTVPPGGPQDVRKRLFRANVNKT